MSMYKVNTYVWSVTKIKIGDITIPRATRGQIKGIEGRIKKKYVVVWEGFRNLKTTVDAKYIATN